MSRYAETFAEIDDSIALMRLVLHFKLRRGGSSMPHSAPQPFDYCSHSSPLTLQQHISTYGQEVTLLAENLPQPRNDKQRELFLELRQLAANHNIMSRLMLGTYPNQLPGYTRNYMVDIDRVVAPIQNTLRAVFPHTSKPLSDAALNAIDASYSNFHLY